MIRSLEVAAYNVQAVVMTRDWFSQVESQVAVGHVGTREQAAANLRNAYVWIFRELEQSAAPFYVVSYEALCQRPDAVMKRLCTALGLEWHEGMLPEPVNDENAKYYAVEAPA